MTMEDFLRQAWPDCSSCGGTGIIEGEIIQHGLHPGDAWERNPDRICHCVPVMIIRCPGRTMTEPISIPRPKRQTGTLVCDDCGKTVPFTGFPDQELEPWPLHRCRGFAIKPFTRWADVVAKPSIHHVVRHCMPLELSPERAARLLRTKCAELEASVRNRQPIDPIYLAADIALIAELLADVIERLEQPVDVDIDDDMRAAFREGFDEGRPPG